MFLTQRIEKALSVTLTIHANQKRKGDNMTPYAVHPVSVAMLLARYSDDENVIIAGLLHDAIEDTEYNELEIERDFGPKVLYIVKEVTESAPKSEPWEKRKMDYLMNIKNKSTEACLVTCADKIHNLKSLSYAYAIMGDALWRRFNASKEKKLWFYEKIYEEINKKTRHGLVRELYLALEEFKGAKVQQPKPDDRAIGPFDLVRWQHFSLEKDNGELALLDVFEKLDDAIKVATRLTKEAREETLKLKGEDDKLPIKDYWNLSSSCGVYDSTGRMVYWADWFAL